MIKISNNIQRMLAKQADWGSTMAGLGTFAKELVNPAGAVDWWRQSFNNNKAPNATAAATNKPAPAPKPTLSAPRMEAMRQPAPQHPNANQVSSPGMNLANILPPAMMHGIQR